MARCVALCASSPSQRVVVWRKEAPKWAADANRNPRGWRLCWRSLAWAMFFQELMATYLGLPTSESRGYEVYG